MRALGMVLLFFLLSGYVLAQDIIIQADKRLNTDLSKYKTYQFASQVDNKLDPGFYFLNDVFLKDMIRTSINNELQGLGYKKVNQSPDLIITFRVFDKPVTLTDYKSYGVNFYGTEIRDSEAFKEYKVEAGTLLLSMVDRKQGLVVWQGFASGLIEGNTFMRNGSKIKQAVNLIFNEYNQRADNFTSIN